MRKLYLFLVIIWASLTLSAQPDGSADPSDTANYPHWITMMQNQDINFFQTQRAFELYFANRYKGKASGWKQFKRWEAFWQSRVSIGGEFPPPTQNIDAYQQFMGSISGGPQFSSGGNWTELGPTALPTNGTGQPNGLGRVNCVAYHPTNASIIYVGAPSGGLWRSTNGGATWAILTNNLPSLGVSCILIDSINPNIIYIGTGDRDGGDAPGIGVYKSTDGGANWAPYNTGLGNRTVSMMVMHPTNHNIIIAATSSGIYKTINAGASWSHKSSNYSHYKDIKFKPGNPSIVYAVRNNDFYRSTNTGDSWTQVTSGLPTAGRFVIGVSPANANYVYVVVGSSSGFTGAYRSTNSGQSFSLMSNSPNILGYQANGSDTRSQAFYDLCIAVDPNNVNTIYVGGINIWKSTNGGSSWTINAHWVGTSAPAVHADQHWLSFNPLNNRLYVGCDGGVYYTANGGSSWIDISSGLGIAQVYLMGQSATSKNLVINGWQDNGTGIYRSGSWATEIGGDGMGCIIDPTDTSYMYGSLYYGDIRRSTNNGSYFYQIADNGTNGINESGAWVTPFTLNATNPNTMYIGYKNVWRSTNVKASSHSSVSWTKISTFGTTSNLSKIESSPANSNLLYVARGTSLFRSDNVNAATPSWTTISGPGNISDMEAHPTNQNILYITAGTNIYKSTNKGASWTSIKGNLPTVSMNTLVYDKNSNEGIYVGTDIGIFYKDASMSQWVSFSTGFPAAAEVTDLAIYYDSNSLQSKLRASTFGRGLWSSDLYSPPNQPPVADFSTTSSTPCQGGASTLNDLSSNIPTSWAWSFTPSTISYVTGSSATSQNPVVQFNATGNYTVQLIASNQYGSDTIVKTSFISVGTPTSAPFSENFESFTTGNPGTFANGWTFSNTGTFNWRANSGSTPTVQSGPNIDHTTGTSTGKYLYTEASSPASAGEVTNLISPCISIPTGTSYQLSFWYHMYGQDILGLHVDIFHNGVWVNDIYTINGPQQSSNAASWLQASTSMASYAGSTIKVRFRVIRGASYNGDVAIDDFAIGNTTNVPVANFNASATNVVVGNTVSFADLSTNIPTSWSWSFSPSTITYLNSTTSTSQNPQVSFNTAGTYSVTLIASNSSGSDTMTKASYISVTSGLSLPYFENFETFTVGTPGAFANGWTSQSTGNYPWTVNSGGTPSNYTGPTVDHTLGTINGKYLFTEASAAGTGNTAQLISPLLNLSSVTNAQVSFWYHMFGAGISALNVDVYHNSTWTTIKTITGQQQASHTAAWLQSQASLLPYVGSSIRVRFRTVSNGNYRNDISIDDVKFELVTPPSNDDPCGATALTVGSTCNYLTSTNVNSTSTIGVPNPSCGGYSGNDVWFKAIAPTSGFLTIDADSVTGSFADGAMAVYKGSCGNLTYLSCADDYQGNGNMPHLALNGLTGGDTIFIRFWKYGGNGTGQFKICVFEPPYLTITPASKNITYLSGSTTFQVQSNQSWSISDNASWVTLTPTSGTGTATITVNYSGNAGAPRNATLTASSSTAPNAYAILTQSSPVVASFTSSTNYLCKNNSATFTNTSTNNTNNHWYIDGSLSGTSSNLNYTFSTTGSHIIKLVVSNSSNSDSTQSVVFVSETPIANAGSNITICEGNSISLNAGVSLGVNQCTSNCNMPSTCASHSNNDNQEYITNVELNGSTNSSANEGVGYQNFTSTLFNVLQKDSVYYLYVTGHTAGNWLEYMDAYIDWNRNGLFDEPAVSMGSATFNGNHIYTGLVSVPSNAVIGKTKLRIIMKYNQAISSGCENGYGYGETEDYMLEIVSIDTVNYSWTGPNSYSATGRDPIINNIPTANNGTYTVTASDDFGCYDTDTKVVTVNAKPNVTFGTIGVLCIDAQPITLTQGSPSGGTYFGTGVSNGVFNPATAGAGTHTIGYVVTNASNCSDTAFQTIVVNSLPTVTLASFTPVCKNAGNIVLTGGSPSGGSYSGTGVSSGQFNPNMAGVGTTTITYSYTDGNNCSSSSQKPIIVNAAPNVTLSNFSSTCSNSNAVVLSGGLPTGGSYSGTGVSNGQFNPLTAGVGTHSISYIYTNSNSCSDTATASITVNSAPSVTMSSLADVCADASSFSLSGGSPTGGIYTGQGVSSGNFSPSIGAGSYNIVYTYTDNNNCSDTAITTQIVHALPTVTFIGLPDTICAGNSNLTLTGSPVGGSFSGPGMSGNIFNTATAGVGSHSITYSYTDINGCANSFSKPIVVQGLPIVNAGTDDSVNYSQTAQLTGTVTGTGNYYYSWAPAALVSSPLSLSTSTVAMTNSQIFTLHAIETTTGCMDSDMVSITVMGGPLSVNVSSSNSQVCSGDSVQLQANAGGGTSNYSYSWSFSGNIFSSVNNPKIIPSATGYYKVVVYDGNSYLADSIFITVNALPTVNFNPLQAICEGSQAFALAGGLPSGGTYSGIGVSNNTFDPSIAGTGNHLITYTYTNANNCSNTATQLQVVNSKPTVSYTSTGAVCNSAVPFTLTGGIPSGGNYYGTGITNNVFNPSIAGIGTHSITYVYSDANSCTDSASANIVVNSAPTANAGIDQTITSNTTANLVGLASGGSGNYSYSWSPASMVVNAGMQNTATVSLTTSTEFMLNVFDTQTSCSDSDKVLITVSGGLLTGNLTSNNTSICLGDSIQLLMLASGGTGNYTYSWTSSPAGFTSNIYNPIFSPIVSTVFYVTLNDGTNQLYDSISVSVSAIPNVDLGNDTLLCGFSNLTLDAGSGFTTYLWSDGSSNQTLNVIGASLSSGPHIYKVEVSNSGNCTGSDSITIFKDNSPYINLGPDATICKLSSIMLDAGYGFSDYLWSTGDTTQIIQIQGTNIGVGNHKIWVRVKSTYGCENTDTLNLKVDDCQSITEMPDYYSIKVYPNPSKGRFNIHLESSLNEVISLELINLQGAILHQSQVNFIAPQTDVVIDLSTLPKGVYIMRLRSDNLLRFERIVIQ